METDTGRWELCEVRLTMRTFWRVTITLEAVATGPTGQRVLGSRAFRTRGIKALDQNPKMREAVSALSSALTSYGWEPLPSVAYPLPLPFAPTVMLPRFRKRLP